MKFISALALLCAAVAAFSQVDPDRTVLTVNGDVVKGSEYYHRMEYLPDVGRVLSGGNVAVYPPGFLTIVQLIDEKLILQLAKQKEVMPTDQEVTDAFKVSTDADPGLLQRWLNSGRSEDELRQQLLIQVAQFKLQTQGITVTDQEVDNFYKSQKIDGLTTYPERVTIRMIAVLNDADKQAVDSDLASGKSFAEVAKARSADITQAQSGELGTVPMAALPENVQKILQSTKIGSVTDWVDVQNAHVKYLVEGKAPEQAIPMDAALRERIRRKMMLDRGVVKNNVDKELSDMRSTAKIDITQKEFAAMYDHFMSTYFHEILTPVPGNGGSGGGGGGN